MKNILKASVYCGTYAKYNNGSIAGAWLNLADYTTKRNFYAACRELHKDEHEPEFMFQDHENIPISMVGESFVSDEVWHVINSIKKYGMDRAAEFAQYCDENGYEQDYETLREFMGYNKNKDSTTRSKDEMSREEMTAKIIAACNGDKFYEKYLPEEASTIAYFGDKLVIFKKPDIETRFCFDDENDAAMDMYRHMHGHDKTGEAYFIRHNIDRAEDLRMLTYFDKKRDYDWEYKKLYFLKRNRNINIFDIVACEDRDKRIYTGREEDLIPLTPDQEKQLHKILLSEKAKFEKRLQNYLKRYGLDKLHTWSYWANA